MEINAKDIMKLRQKTGLPMMECKKALEEAGGDEEGAIQILKKRGLDKAAKKSERATNAGWIEAYSHDGRIGVLVEMACETDFVVRNEEFGTLAHDIALQVAAMNPLYLSPETVPEGVKNEQRQIFAEQARTEGKPDNIIEKIVEGKLKSYFEEVCLLNQKFIKDQDKTIGDLIKEKIAKIGENIGVVRFIRYEIGEC